MFRRLASTTTVGLALLSGLVYGADPLPRARPEDVQVDSTVLAKIKPQLQNYTSHRQLPGAVVMMARHGKLIYEAAVQYDRIDYIFRLFSQSKPLTTAAAMILVDEGILKVDDPVTKWIPEFAALQVIKNGTMGAPIETEPLKRQMTILHLLTHTAGFVYGDGGDTTVDALYRSGKVLDMWDQDLDGLVNKLARIPLLNHPGVTWHYSVGIDVLGAVIQRAAQMPLEEFMRTRLFEPLGMKDTGFWVPPSQLHRLVPYWTSAAAPGMLVPIPNSYTGTDFSKEPKLKSGGGGLVSTAHDFLRFGQMLLNKGELDGVRVLKEETVAAYLTNQLPKSLLPFQMGPVVFRSSGFGYGVAVQNVDVPLYAPLGEVSWGGAASTNWWASPETGTVIVGLTQVAPYSNLVADGVKPFGYAALQDWPPKQPAAETVKEAEVQYNGLMGQLP